MVYLEHSGSKFWRCELGAAEDEVTITYGKCGNAGRTMTKQFGSSDGANSYMEKQEASKRKGGYTDAKDPSNTKTTGGKRKASPPAPTKKVGLKNHAAPTIGGDDDVEGAEVDSGVAGADAALASRAQVYKGFHAKLALVDPSKNHDKYYILQILVDETNKKPKGRSSKRSKQGPQYYLFTRWGRTGTGGTCKLEGPWANDEETAEKNFVKIFKAKTGAEWEKAVPGAAPKSNKYEYLAAAKRSDGDGSWYYFLQNDPLGKPNGWYPYDKSNSEETEELFGEYVASNKSLRLSTRLVHSETSGFTYRVDLQALVQTNTQSGTSRPIGRTTNGRAPPNKQPSQTMPTPQLSTPGSAQPTPVRTVTAKGKMKKSAPAAVRSLSAPMSAAAGAVDSAASSALQGGSIFDVYDVMLNQTNLGANANKFYKISLVETGSGVHLFTKWGRVGEAGATQEVGPMDSEKAVKEFEKKFKAKTGNKWEDRDNFQSKKGKYTIVEMEKDADAAEAMSSCASATSGSSSSRKMKTLPCTLDTKTKALVDLIFDADMFKTAMSAMNLDPNKLPLGALSKAQIERGFDALEKLEEEIDGRANPRTLMELTSDFYTIIPHAFGRSRGPVLNTKDAVSEKYDMLNTLTDIEAAQTMQKKNRGSSESDEVVKHASDENYEQLTTDLTLVGDEDEDRNVIEQYLKNTMAKGYRGGMKLRDVWRVNRHDESERFAEHKDLANRRLLWHGTNVAVVAAILKGGLRFMPHSGGRVGRGIYLADQHEKSAWYVASAKNTIIMFLVEAALGRQHEITMDDPSLVSAPKGYDSVLAKGTKAPKKDVEIDIDGNLVKVPQGKPVDSKISGGSSFAHNEFLIYKESQHRIRYILRFDE